jgi:hypothetical protein
VTNPADLTISGKSDPSNKDYFDITINPLKLVTDYNFQFQWIFEDKAITEKVGDNWSNVFKVTTISDAINKPQFRASDIDYTGNTLLISWSGKDYLGADYKNNLQRIDIYAKGGSFGDTYKVVGQFTKAGTQTITASAAQYYVKLQAVSNSGGVSLFSDEQTIITESPLIVDLTPPDNPTNVGVSAGVDAKDQTGFSAYATFSWTHHPNAATNGTRGYRLRWTYDTVNPIYEYGFVDYPNNSYTATGLIPNVQYTYQVASVDQFNNTKEYYTGGTFTAVDSTNPDGWARLKSYISIGGATGDLFKFGTGIPSSINTSLTTTPALTAGNYNGIILNKTGNNNNYWLTTGQLRVGGNTQFMYWDGTNLSITGDLGVGGGATVAGHLFMKTAGASIYSGSIVNDTLPDGTAGFVLNNAGLLVQNNETSSNRKYVRLDPATGTLFANNAQISGNIVITSGVTKTAIDDAADKATTATTNVSTLTGTVNNLSDDVDTLSLSLAGKVDTTLYSKSEIINKLNDGNGGTSIRGSVISTGAIISNNVSAGENGIRGGTFTTAGSIFDLDNGTISTPNFRINSSGSAFFKGSIESGSSISGASFSTTAGATYEGWIGINRSNNNKIEFINNSNTVVGQMYTFNSGSEVILQYGSGSALGYPASTGYISLNNQGITIGRTNVSGTNIGGLTVNNTDAQFSGVNVSTIQGAPIGSFNYYMRNIGMGTGSKSASDTDGYRGDIWIQYT